MSPKHENGMIFNPVLVGFATTLTVGKVEWVSKFIIV